MPLIRIVSTWTDPEARERASAFVRFAWRRFLAEGCFSAAGALAYTTLFALVPLTAVVFGVISAFPVFDEWSEALQEFIFANFVPEAGRAVQGYLQTFADNATRMTSLGIVTLILSAVLMMSSIEDAYNRIWRIHTARTAVARFVVYWTVLTLGPVLVVASIGTSSYLFSLPFIAEVDRDARLGDVLLRAAPFLVAWAAFTLSYVVIPNRRVQLRYALIGGLVAALLFDLSKRGFALYLSQVPSYQQIYGALAVVPIFLLWIYLSWVVVLLGASLTASLGAFRYTPSRQQWPPGREFVALVRVLGHLYAAQREGRGLRSDELRGLEPLLSDDLLGDLLDVLQRMHVVERTELGHWVLVRDLARLSVLDLHVGSGYALPPDYGVRPEDGGAAPSSPLLAETLAKVAARTRADLDFPLARLFDGDAGIEKAAAVQQAS